MKNNIELRYATVNDCETLTHVIKLVIEAIPYYNDLAKRDEISKFQYHELKEKIETDKYSVLIAIVNNIIVGFCLSRFDDYVIWLEWFGILESYRGMGIANMLLNELDNTVVPRGCHKIWCDCRTSNSASIHILVGHGYKELVTIPNHWYQQDFILWEKASNL